jgi:hypothetical protein
MTEAEIKQQLDNAPGPIGYCALCLADNVMVRAASLVDGTGLCADHALRKLDQLDEPHLVEVRQ